MKISRTSLCAGLSGLLIAGLAAGAEPAMLGAPGAHERDKAVMLYFTKSFGGTARQPRTPLAFGLRYQQSPAYDMSRVYPLMDLRYSLGGRKTVALGGALMLDSSIDSSAGPSWDNPWLYVGAAAGLAAALCALEEVLCEDNRRSPGTSTETG
ncbi:MAG: hypothetical protein H7Y89_10450 [Steroidobacteraceae bacterium]|nr:hypothetical protein [Steroidobacteraceae bacterium]